MNVKNDFCFTIGNVVEKMVDLERTSETAINYRIRTRGVNYVIAKTTSSSKEYMNCLKVLEHNSDAEIYSNPAYYEIFNAWKNAQESLHVALRDSNNVIFSFNKWRKSAIIEILMSMGITDNNRQKMFVTLVMERLTKR